MFEIFSSVRFQNWMLFHTGQAFVAGSHFASPKIAGLVQEFPSLCWACPTFPAMLTLRRYQITNPWYFGAVFWNNMAWSQKTYHFQPPFRSNILIDSLKINPSKHLKKRSVQQSELLNWWLVLQLHPPGPQLFWFFANGGNKQMPEDVASKQTAEVLFEVFCFLKEAETLKTSQ